MDYQHECSVSDTSNTSNTSLHLHTMVSSFRPPTSAFIFYAQSVFVMLTSALGSLVRKIIEYQLRLCLADAYTFISLFSRMHTHSSPIIGMILLGFVCCLVGISKFPIVTGLIVCHLCKIPSHGTCTHYLTGT